MSWLNKLLSAENEASTKRFVALVLVVVYVISHFLLMYIKIEIANKDLVSQSMDGVKFMILIFGGFIVAEQLIAGYVGKWKAQGEAEVKRAEMGAPHTSVQQNVKEQTIQQTDGKDIKTSTT